LELRENTMTAAETIDREFLTVRARILEIAAALDRVQRGDGYSDSDPRLDRLREGIQILLRPDDDRAEQVQLIFSRPYEDGWQRQFAVSTRK
jgi:hypothetical protein